MKLLYYLTSDCNGTEDEITIRSPKGEEMAFIQFWDSGENKAARAHADAALIVAALNAYWWKHPNLHGFIVGRFAQGDDSCQKIELSISALQKILQAVENAVLPQTTGFFFGVSDGSEAPGDFDIFREAIAWLEAKDAEAWRSVYYQASW